VLSPTRDYQTFKIQRRESNAEGQRHPALPGRQTRIKIITAVRIFIRASSLLIFFIQRHVIDRTCFLVVRVYGETIDCQDKPCPRGIDNYCGQIAGAILFFEKWGLTVSGGRECHLPKVMSHPIRIKLSKENRRFRRSHGARKGIGGSCGEMDVLGSRSRDLSGPGRGAGRSTKRFASMLLNSFRWCGAI